MVGMTIRKRRKCDEVWPEMGNLLAQRSDDPAGIAHDERGQQTIGVTEELAFLRDEICQGAQGYLLSRPAPIESFHAVTEGHQKQLPPLVPTEVEPLRQAG